MAYGEAALTVALHGAPDPAIRDELARIERGDPSGRGPDPRGVRRSASRAQAERGARERSPPPARARGDTPWPCLADHAPRRSSLPMSGPRLMAALERANDAGGRCALRRSGDAHRQGAGSCRTRTSCASAPRAASADRGAQAVLGATPQSGGLLRVRGQVCLRTPVPAPSGRSQPAIPPGRVLDR